MLQHRPRRASAALLLCLFTAGCASTTGKAGIAPDRTDGLVYVISEGTPEFKVTKPDPQFTEKGGPMRALSPDELRGLAAERDQMQRDARTGRGSSNSWSMANIAVLQKEIEAGRRMGADARYLAQLYAQQNILQTLSGRLRHDFNSGF